MGDEPADDLTFVSRYAMRLILADARQQVLRIHRELWDADQAELDAIVAVAETIGEMRDRLLDPRERESP